MSYPDMEEKMENSVNENKEIEDDSSMPKRGTKTAAEVLQGVAKHFGKDITIEQAEKIVNTEHWCTKTHELRPDDVIVPIDEKHVKNLIVDALTNCPCALKVAPIEEHVKALATQTDALAQRIKNLEARISIIAVKEVVEEEQTVIEKTREAEVLEEVEDREKEIENCEKLEYGAKPKARKIEVKYEPEKNENFPYHFYVDGKYISAVTEKFTIYKGFSDLNTEEIESAKQQFEKLKEQKSKKECENFGEYPHKECETCDDNRGYDACQTEVKRREKLREKAEWYLKDNFSIHDMLLDGSRIIQLEEYCKYWECSQVEVYEKIIKHYETSEEYYKYKFDQLIELLFDIRNQTKFEMYCINDETNYLVSTDYYNPTFNSINIQGDIEYVAEQTGKTRLEVVIELIEVCNKSDVIKE